VTIPYHPTLTQLVLESSSATLAPGCHADSSPSRGPGATVRLGAGSAYSVTGGTITQAASTRGRNAVPSEWIATVQGDQGGHVGSHGDQSTADATRPDNPA